MMIRFGSPATPPPRATPHGRRNRRRRGHVRLGWPAFLVAVVVAAPLQAQTPPPDARWLTFSTDHFRVTYTPDLEVLARHAAGVAERAHAALRDELASAPRGTIELVVTDHVDLTNGYATPFPSNRIVVFVRPPLDLPQLAYARDWVELVVAHELVHIFHMDIAGPVGRAVRTVFGRVPMFWPVFPTVGTPLWSLEGLATHYESRLTGGGRVHGSFHDMVIRTAALEDGLPALRDVSSPSPLWPAGQRSYIYGASFMRWIAERYGPDVHARLLDATGSAVLPTFLFFDRVAKEATGREFDALFAEWRQAAIQEAERTRERLAMQGLTSSEPVAGAGPFAVAPSISPDGRRLTYGADDFRSDPATRLLDLTTGELRTLARRNQPGSTLGAASWLPDGSGLITAQLDFRGPYRLLSDLWRIDLDGREERLTRGARLTEPDVAPDGRRVAAIQAAGGALHLVIHDLETGATRVLARAGPGEGFAGPRWSPDGRRLAAARYADGRVDLVLVEPTDGSILALTADDALDLAPTWMPDGRRVLFWSDRTGIPNLFAAVPSPGAGIEQVSNVLGGAFDPEVSPDGLWIYFAAYHADGWRIERTPLDPSTWRPAPSAGMAYGDAVLMAPEAAGAADAGGPGERPAGAGEVGGPASPYSAWPSVRPYFWFPSYTSKSVAAPDPLADRLRFWGAFSMGWDAVQRHSWSASMAVDPWTRRVLGDASWTWRGLGVPELAFGLERNWSGAGSLQLGRRGARREAIWLREDRLTVDALLLRRGWRATSWLQGGAEVVGRDFELHRGGEEGEALLRDAGVADLDGVVGLRAGGGWSNARAYPFSISLEDGLSLSAGARSRWRAPGFGHSYDQLHGRVAGYLGFPWWGFADHVVAGRLAALVREGRDAVPVPIGGATAAPEDILLGTTSAGSGLFLPVRGFDDGARRGTRAWTASSEYRVPLHLRGWHRDILGLTFTALSASLFVDAGDAWCDRPDLECRTAPGDPLLSTGGELSLDYGILHSILLRLRGGFAIPLNGPLRNEDDAPWSPRNWRLYLALGPSF